MLFAHGSKLLSKEVSRIIEGTQIHPRKAITSLPFRRTAIPQYQVYLSLIPRSNEFPQGRQQCERAPSAPDQAGDSECSPHISHLFYI